MTILLGVVYPARHHRHRQVLFPASGEGSFCHRDGKVIGSELIGQNFTKPEYFQPRPSAAGADGYDAGASSGSNLRADESETDRPREGLGRAIPQGEPGLHRADSGRPVTASASGLDPHISPANADLQAPRVAKARGVEITAVRTLVAHVTEQPWLGFIGEPRVNVLELNLALDGQFGRK